MKKKTKDIIITALIFLGISLLNYKSIASFFDNLAAQSNLNQYSEAINDCIKTEQEALGDKKVIGLEYSCAIKVASSIYKEDPDTAIELCKKYSILPVLPDDPTAGRVQTSACKSSIEKRLK